MPLIQMKIRQSRFTHISLFFINFHKYYWNNSKNQFAYENITDRMASLQMVPDLTMVQLKNLSL